MPSQRVDDQLLALVVGDAPADDPVADLRKLDNPRPLCDVETMRGLGELPGPPRLPLLGNALSIRPTSLHTVTERWCAEHGPIYRFDLGSKVHVGVADAALIAEVLRARPDRFRRWEEIEQVSDECGLDGVFSAEGEDWRRQRRLAVTALNAAHLARYFDVIRVACERLHRRLRKAAAAGAPVDLAPLFSAYTLDVTSSLAFGQDIETLDDIDRLGEHLHRVFDTLARRSASPVPYWRLVKLPADRATDRSLKVLHGVVGECISAARARLRERPELQQEPENFLEGMLAAQAAEGRFDEAELFGNALTMMLAGEDTTSHTLAWASWLLATEPEAQDRLAAEAAAVLGEHPWPPDHARAEALPYADGVVRETLRLRPAAPVIFAQAIEDVTVADVDIPAGTRLLLHARLAALAEDNFADPEAFRPQRWIDHGEGPHNAKALLTFGAGPRFCPGRNLALLEGRAALAMVARGFEVAPDPAARPVRERFGFTMAPEGLSLCLRTRAGAPA